jgi:hypothetical protein
MVAAQHDGGGGAGGSVAPFDIGAFTLLLQELRIDHGVIAEITGLLGQGLSMVEDHRPPTLPASSFGTLGNGQSMGHHTELARHAVVDVLATMVHDLQHYNEGVVTFSKGVNVADEHAQADLDNITAQLSSVRSDTTEGWGA